MKLQHGPYERIADGVFDVLRRHARVCVCQSHSQDRIRAALIEIVKVLTLRARSIRRIYYTCRQR